MGDGVYNAVTHCYDIHYPNLCTYVHVYCIYRCVSIDTSIYELQVSVLRTFVAYLACPSSNANLHITDVCMFTSYVCVCDVRYDIIYISWMCITLLACTYM